jgi:hypothetical protein
VNLESAQVVQLHSSLAYFGHLDEEVNLQIDLGVKYMHESCGGFSQTWVADHGGALVDFQEVDFDSCDKYPK